MLNDKTCISCGSNLKFNNTTGFFICNYCGKIYTSEGKNPPPSLALVDEQMRAKHYPEAKNTLLKLRRLEPNNPSYVLRSILCQFQAASIPQLLTNSRNNATQLHSIKNSVSWDNLHTCLPDEKKPLTEKIMDYCNLSLDITVLNRGIDKSKVYLQSEPTRPAKFWDPEETSTTVIAVTKNFEYLYAVRELLSLLIGLAVCGCTFGAVTFLIANQFTNGNYSLLIAAIVTIITGIIVSMIINHFVRLRAKNKPRVKPEKPYKKMNPKLEAITDKLPKSDATIVRKARQKEQAEMEENLAKRQVLEEKQKAIFLEIKDLAAGL